MPDPTPPPRAVHLVGAPGPLREAVLGALGSEGVLVHDAVDGVRDGRDGLDGRPGSAPGDDGRDRGRPGGRSTRDRPPALVLLLADSVSAADQLALLRELASGGPPWIVGLVEEGAEGVGVRTLSLGWPRTLDELAEYARGEGEPPLELRDVVRRVARARHDINNPLTSALAQTQLLLLDHDDDGLGGELRDVEAQIKRITDLVAGTASIRPRDG